MWTRVNRHTCNLYSVVECASLQVLSSNLREGSGCTMNTQHQSPLSPPPPTHTQRETMDAELFLGEEEEEEEVEESPLPTKSADCYRSLLQADKVRTHTNGMPTTCSAQPAQSAWCLCHVHGTPLLHSCMCQPGLQGLCERGCGLCSPPTVCVCVAPFCGFY